MPTTSFSATTPICRKPHTSPNISFVAHVEHIEDTNTVRVTSPAVILTSQLDHNNVARETHHTTVITADIPINPKGLVKVAELTDSTGGEDILLTSQDGDFFHLQGVSVGEEYHFPHDPLDEVLAGAENGREIPHQPWPEHVGNTTAPCQGSSIGVVVPAMTDSGARNPLATQDWFSSLVVSPGCVIASQRAPHVHEKEIDGRHKGYFIADVPAALTAALDAAESCLKKMFYFNGDLFGPTPEPAVVYNAFRNAPQLGWVNNGWGATVSIASEKACEELPGITVRVCRPELLSGDAPTDAAVSAVERVTDKKLAIYEHLAELEEVIATDGDLPRWEYQLTLLTQELVGEQRLAVHLRNLAESPK